jgi:hypothetical protein
MTDEPLKHTAVWTDDCQGKKDFDGEVVSISTRYWPGYHTMFDTAEPEKGFQQVRTGGPHAIASLVIRHEPIEGEEYSEWLTLAEADFAGETEEEVKGKVEAWVQGQFLRLAAALRREFGV